MKRALPLSLRFFLLGFLPIALALLAGFQWFRVGIVENVRGGLQQTLADAQQAQTNLRLDARRQRLSLLSTLAENASLKAVMALTRESADNSAAKLTAQDHLLELATSLDADFVGLRDDRGRTVAGILRRDKKWTPIESLPPEGRQMAPVGGRLLELATVPVNSGPENLGTLIVGKAFDPASFHRQAVLVERQAVTAQVGLAREAPANGFRHCHAPEPCAVVLAGAHYLALPVDRRLLEDGYTLWTLHSVEQASSQLLGTATFGFWLVLGALLAAALLADLFGARAVTRPLVDLIDRLHESERSGVLQGDFPETSSTKEVNELARAFNLAAASLAESQRRLDQTYLEITQTMAQTLDARDPYTAGHSSRVSDYAVAIAKAMNLSAQEIEIIRVGANLHDIGKIGIPDDVLRKPGPLTEGEFEIIKRHTVIGKRILEGVAKFRDYLSIVELHHENADGSGYPWGLRGEKIPLAARIVHVVDAYDAMTSNRPYRQATPSAAAQETLRRFAGTQFDPAVVEVFLRLFQAGILTPPPAETGLQLAELSQNLQEQQRKAYELDPVH